MKTISKLSIDKRSTLGSYVAIADCEYSNCNKIKRLRILVKGRSVDNVLNVDPAFIRVVVQSLQANEEPCQIQYT